MSSCLTMMPPSSRQHVVIFSTTTQAIWLRQQVNVFFRRHPTLNARTWLRGKHCGQWLQFAEHVHINVISSCAQALHALRVLRAHGMDDASLQTICWLVIIAKLTYASSACWGYTSATDRQRLEAFIKPRSRFLARSANATTSVHALHSNKVEKHQKMYFNC